ncbi:MAG TPA: cation-translocating P-type ATPase [Syntrophomonadaceae bacterium]|nr:cation-translocating P-type ATPase [Syntrophomonadaceae bacterium]
MKQKAWWQMNNLELMQELRTSQSMGLSTDEAQRRLAAGPNELEKGSGPNPLYIFLSQFMDTMVLVLLGATVISAMVGSLADAVTIMAIVIINALLGFFQEYRAERSLDEIRKLSSPNALVLRGGDRKRIPASELVPGDIIFLESGDRISADVRILETFSMEFDESALTGESLPVSKLATTIDTQEISLAEQKNMGFSGTVVTRGRGLAVVVETGMETVMGQIARIISESQPSLTPLQQRLDRLGKALIVICGVVCLAVSLLGIYRGEEILTMLMAGISLAVAAIPEGLTAIVTVVLALGVQRMARRNAIVRKLPAVETLGCTTVICSDKTGTLTQNKMNVVKLGTMNGTVEVQGEGYEPQGRFKQGKQEIKPLADPTLKLLVQTAFHCNNARLEKKKGVHQVEGDPMEGALLAMAGRAGLKGPGLRLREIPFDSDRKRMSVVVEGNGQTQVFCKGALEVLLPLCTQTMKNGRPVLMDAQAEGYYIRLQEEWAAQGCRVLAFAAKTFTRLEGQKAGEKELESRLCLLGICALVDPPRPGVAKAVADCQAAGIVPVMITGDHPATALAIARDIGISTGSEVISGLDMERLSDEELYKRTMKNRVFARVSPQHKNRIVKVLKRRQEVVAMTGDGVNDAPALKAADIGVAMGLNGTEVAKEASAMVLADDDFSTIIEAVYQGRAIYDNIRKFIRYLLGCNIGEVLVMFLASLMGMPLPLLPIQILWVNLVTDGLPAMALGLEPPEPGIMRRKPRPPEEGVFARGLGLRVFTRGIYISLITLTAFVAGLVYCRLNGMENLDTARSMALTTLVLGQLFYVFECRSENQSPFELGFFENRFLLIAVLCSVGLQFTVLVWPPFSSTFHTTPLTAWQWLLVIALTGSKLAWNFIQYTWQRVFASRPHYVKINA